MFAPEPEPDPVTPPVTVPTVQVNELGTLDVNAILVLFPLHIAAVLGVVIAGDGLTVTVIA